MLGIKRVRIRSYEKGFHFRHGELRAMLGKGVYWFLNPFLKDRVEVCSQRDAWLPEKDLDLIVKSGVLEGHAEVIDLKNHERALVWVDGRFEAVVGSGLYAVWTEFHDIRVERFDVENLRFEHDRAEDILDSNLSMNQIERVTVEQGFTGLVYQNGRLIAELEPGRYAYWRKAGQLKVLQVDRRESVLDIAGQEIMTADKVTLRLNATVTYKVTDPKKAVGQVEDYRQAVYREGQLALRSLVGTRELDSLLSDKETVAEDLLKVLRNKAESFGIKILDLGIRDIILPGEMREILNRVTEARKAAEANLISRREETAAMRSQANTAKLLESNPTLMRLRELEVLEKVAEHSKLQVLLGDKGLAEKVVNLL